MCFDLVNKKLYLSRDVYFIEGDFSLNSTLFGNKFDIVTYESKSALSLIPSIQQSTILVQTNWSHDTDEIVGLPQISQNNQDEIASQSIVSIDTSVGNVIMAIQANAKSDSSVVTNDYLGNRFMACSSPTILNDTDSQFSNFDEESHMDEQVTISMVTRGARDIFKPNPKYTIIVATCEILILRYA